MKTEVIPSFAQGNHQLRDMSEKPKLTYLNGRGRMECIRWLLASAGVECEESFVESREQYEKLINDGCLLFGQLPLVEIDGMKLVQTRAILNYIAGKYNLHGKNLKERAQIDMFVEGTMDLFGLILMYPFCPPEQKEKQAASIAEKATTRFFPVYEKALKQHGQEFLVGNCLSLADIQLLEAILATEEIKADILAKFPQLQVLYCDNDVGSTYPLVYGKATFKARISNIPNIKKFLQPGSLRKPPADDTYVATVKKVFKME
ncbi:glutathione S-transferase-like [Sceloporus undulatus]|uniref:glutathione S-transferase-like n=1 Tax=Sceloporus undulatus TaxID=8520 RepID=UPI001C4CB06C|nr:glutathione S-transferase-like [Sceloporus undulatus]